MDYAFYISYGICFGFFFGYTTWQLRKLRIQIDELRKNIDLVETKIRSLDNQVDKIENEINSRIKVRNRNGKS